MKDEAQDDPPRRGPDEPAPVWRRRTEQALLAGTAAGSLGVIAWCAFFSASPTIDLVSKGRWSASTPGWRTVEGSEPRGAGPLQSLAGRSRAAIFKPSVPPEAVADDGTSPTPATSERPAFDKPTKKTVGAAFQLDVNTADRNEWMQLPGIGETLAARILALREASGPFKSHDDLLRVSGIGEKTLAKLKPYFLPLPAPEP